MLHDKITGAETNKVEPTEPEPPAFQTATVTPGLIHIPHEARNGDCGCLAGFARLLIWATRNNGH